MRLTVIFVSVVRYKFLYLGYESRILQKGVSEQGLIINFKGNPHLYLKPTG